jgi:hypothetical protein
MGIVVPIVFFVTGWIVSFWFKDTTLGNPDFIGWTSMYSAIVLALAGLAALGMSDTEDEAGNKVKKKHDFFFIPIIVWALVLGGLSLYLLVFSGKGKDEDTTESTVDLDAPAEVAEATTRLVNFYNPTSAPLTFIIADDTKDGLIERTEIAPMATEQRELAEGTYLFSAFNAQKETTLAFPDRKYAGDAARYKMHEDEKGTFYQRIVNPMTVETDDYDEAWIVLDGKTNLLLVNVTSACDAEATEAGVQKADWAAGIQEEFEAIDMVEPLYNQFMKDKMIQVVGPGAKLPTEVGPKDIVYLLVPYAGKGDKNKVITQAVLAARF